MKTVITYGTFDIFHLGHLRLLNALRSMGDRLIVAVSTDEFNSLKGKTAFFRYADRAAIVDAIRCVDMVIPEMSWEQKESDIEKYAVSIFGIGDDWRGKFDHLADKCAVVYLPRTEGVSSSSARAHLRSEISGG